MMSVKHGTKYRRKQCGATLVEVMMGLVMLLFMSTALTGIFFYTQKLTHKERDLAVATNLAVSRIEAIRQQAGTTRGFDSLENIQGAFYKALDPVLEKKAEEGKDEELGRMKDFIYDVEVRKISPGASVKYVGVNVYYRKAGVEPLEPDLEKGIGGDGKVIKMGTCLSRP